MARRRGRNGDGIGLFLLAAAAFVLIFVVRVFVTGALYFLPFAWLLILLIVRKDPISAPKLVDVDEYDLGDPTRRVEALIGQFLAASQRADRLNHAATEDGLQTTKTSDYARFDTRQRGARPINDQLDECDAQMRNLAYQIREEKAQVLRDWPLWRANFDSWVVGHSIRLSVHGSVFLVLIAVVSLYVVSIATPMNFTGMLATLGPWNQILLWQPVESPYLGIAIPVAAIAYATLFLSFPLHRRSLGSQLDISGAARWQSLSEKWDLDGDLHLFGVSFSGSGEQRHNEEEGRRNTRQEGHASDAWWSILGVKADATVDEIKVAYREAIKGYHSDKVATLGQKLRDLADAESKKINVAYDNAKQQRGFR